MQTDLLTSHLQFWCFSAPLKYTKNVFANSVLYQVVKKINIWSKVTNFALCVLTLRQMIYVRVEWMLCACQGLYVGPGKHSIFHMTRSAGWKHSLWGLRNLINRSMSLPLTSLTLILSFLSCVHVFLTFSVHACSITWNKINLSCSIKKQVSF